MGMFTGHKQDSGSIKLTRHKEFHWNNNLSLFAFYLLQAESTHDILFKATRNKRKLKNYSTVQTI